MDFQIMQLYPGIYHLHFGTKWQVAMHFLRFQEYYESAKYADQVFHLVDYMEWYQSDYGEGKFSYPTDWTGFNVPSSVVDAVLGQNIPDYNRYDEFMETVVRGIRREREGQPFYLIGTSEEAGAEKDVLDHEIAHGFYATNEEYRADMDKLLDEFPKAKFKKASEILIKMTYHPRVAADEIHAYSATGPCSTLKKTLTPKVCKPFKEMYKSWREKLANVM